MKREFQTELLIEIIEDWDLQQTEDYIAHLLVRRTDLDEWIRQVQRLARKKKNKSTPENGPRDGR